MITLDQLLVLVVMAQPDFVQLGFLMESRKQRPEAEQTDGVGRHLGFLSLGREVRWATKIQREGNVLG